MKIGYWAQLADDTEASPTAMLGSASPEDAAGAFSQRLIEQSEGAWTAGTIRVWGAKEDPANAIVFDITARFVESEDDENEIDCEVEIIERLND